MNAEILGAQRQNMYLCAMFQIDQTIVSEDVINKDFVCNLSACKGACCIDGDAGAPLTKEEAEILEDIYPKVKPFLRKKGIEAIEAQGTSTKNEWDEIETPLINGADCAYVIFDNKTLQAMAYFLPNNKDKFLKVNGVGEVKYEKYGKQFLALINALRADDFQEPIQ